MLVLRPFLFSYIVLVSWSTSSTPSTSHVALATIVVFTPTSKALLYFVHSPPFIEYSIFFKLSLLHVLILTVVFCVLSMRVVPLDIYTLYVLSLNVVDVLPLTHFVHPSISLYPLPLAYIIVPAFTLISPV